MESLKILLISTSIYPNPPSHYGGVEAIVWDLAECLDKKGHEVTIAGVAGTKVPLNGAVICNDTPESFDFGKEANMHVSMRTKFKEYDIVHDHSHFKYSYVYKADHPGEKWGLLSTLHCECDWNLPPPVTRPNLIGISANHSRQSSAKIGRSFRTVHNGIDINRYPYNRNNGDRLLFVARIARYKGAHEFATLCNTMKLPGDICGEDIFTGDPVYSHEVIRQCDGQMLKYHGTVSHEEKVEMMGNAKALVFPLLWNEPFGIVPIEAMACGTPVITRPLGAMPELVVDGETGFLVKTLDEFEEAIAKVDQIKPNDCRKRARKFTREVMSAKYLNNYKRILNGEEW